MPELPIRAGGLRLIRFTIAALCVGVCLNSVGVGVTFKLNSNRVDQINQERLRNVITNCRDVNARHDETIRQLNILSARREQTASPAEQARIRQGRESTTLLIEALVPKRDCTQLARTLVDSTQ